MGQQSRREKTLGHAHDGIARDSCPPLLQRILAGSFYECDPPLVHLDRCHIRKLDTVDFRNPGVSPAGYVVELFLAPFETKYLRQDRAKLLAITLEGLRLARPVGSPFVEQI